MSLIKEIENKAAQYNFSKDNLLERFTAIVAVPTRKGIEDWKKEIFVPEEHNNDYYNMEREKTPELGERIMRLMKWVHYEKNSPYRSLEEKATLREVATLLIQAFPEFRLSNKDTIGI